MYACRYLFCMQKAKMRLDLSSFCRQFLEVVNVCTVDLLAPWLGLSPAGVTWIQTGLTVWQAPPALGSGASQPLEGASALLNLDS